MMRTALVRFVIALLLLSAGAAWASPSHPSIAGTYSNLRFNAEGSDLLGTELLILPRRSGADLAWTVVVQIAEGGAPCVAIAPLTVKGESIEFSLPESSDCGALHFRGTLSPTEIVLKWDSGTIEHLKRGASYWK